MKSVTFDSLGKTMHENEEEYDMKNIIKRAFALLAAGALLFSLSACTGDGGAEVKTLFNGGIEVEDSSTGARVREGNVLEVPTMYYKHFGADPSLGDDAALTYGGWKKADVPLNADKTAIVVMHAAYLGEAEQAPEQFQYCEYVPRSYRLADENFAQVLDAARAAGIKIYHVPFGTGYYEDMPGYIETQALGAEEKYAPRDKAETDDVLSEMYAFKNDNVTPGPNAWDGIRKARAEYLSFLPAAMPQGSEPIATSSNELAAVAKRDGINHLIYMGFAVDTCLLTDEGGMVNMQQRGFMCSAVKDCVTAVENRESTPSKHHTDTALWRVSLNFGFVYEGKDLADAFGLIKK